MKTDTTTDHFDEMTDFLSREAKGMVLDSLACIFHNEGYNLEGNTEDNDVTWLANRISLMLDDVPYDRCTEERKLDLQLIARAAKDCIPALAERMASRYIRVSKAVRTMERIAKQQGK